MGAVCHSRARGASTSGGERSLTRGYGFRLHGHAEIVVGAGEQGFPAVDHGAGCRQQPINDHPGWINGAKSIANPRNVGELVKQRHANPR